MVRRNTSKPRRPSTGNPAAKPLLSSLRQQMRSASLGPIEITQPMEELPHLQPTPVRQPPPGGWKDDEGWSAEADYYQSISGEDAQC